MFARVWKNKLAIKTECSTIITLCLVISAFFGQTKCNSLYKKAQTLKLNAVWWRQLTVSVIMFRHGLLNF